MAVALMRLLRRPPKAVSARPAKKAPRFSSLAGVFQASH
jgi:hypothetical protein